MRTASVVLLAAAAVPALAGTGPSDSDWPSYNRLLTSERFAPQTELTRENVARLEVLCSYDTHQQLSFHTGPLVVAGTLYATTDSDTFALDATSCQERWRAHEDIQESFLRTNRGAAYLEGRLFRGLPDGRVVAYDAANGQRLWEVRIADNKRGESVPAAPIAWGGLVFIGNAGGDNYGVKGRMYALDAATGKTVWEFYLVPKENPDATHADSWGNDADAPVTGGATWTSYSLDPASGLLYIPGGNPAPDFVTAVRPGDNLYTNSIVVLDARSGAYRTHYQLAPRDFHDWDVSSAPVLLTSGKRHRLLEAPKDGHLYGYDLANGQRVFRTPITTIENDNVPLSEKGTRFCPGVQGGTEWNGPAYDPDTNLAFTGTVDWCSTVYLKPKTETKSGAIGEPWTGARAPAIFGKMDPPGHYRGWLTAADADSGEIHWRFETPAPILGAVTPTAGGLVFFGDLAGNFYAMDKANGKQLWSTRLEGAIAGGVVSYAVAEQQHIAVAAGATSPIWPTPKVNAKIVVFGLKP
ncbi:MAG TPA: PQQ-binding-like beta-propeller repeat protein [Steroidobacteraceae bacterium]|nr:PQQ-binding-like beta-propeller repeat protein [Steroidobacteraceae bacterium]